MGTITGKVTAPGGAGIAGVSVFASSVSGGGFGFVRTTDASGNYTLRVTAGSYRISFSPPSSSQWVSEYYNNVRDFSAATTVTVAAGATAPNINAQLAQVGTITGRVTAPGGTAVAGVNVFGELDRQRRRFRQRHDRRQRELHAACPCRVVPDPVQPAVGFAVGVGVLQRRPRLLCGDGGDGRLRGDGRRTSTPSSPRWAQITGRVTAPGGAAIAGVNVSASSIGSGGGFGIATTDVIGNYTLRVPAGSYRIQFSPPSSSQWVSEYYNDVRDFAAATAVTVAAGATVAEHQRPARPGGHDHGPGHRAWWRRHRRRRACRERGRQRRRFRQRHD